MKRGRNRLKKPQKSRKPNGDINGLEYAFFAKTSGLTKTRLNENVTDYGGF